ncbi:cupredoxin domain-containing protein [Patescibacteria group bacterium]|nr:cupredoxin domain-containing protein [Patescibacteria group bacterium]
MEQKQKKWLIIAIIVVILLLIIIFGSKKEPAMFEEDYLPEGFDRESLEDMEAAPEVKIQEPVEVAPEASKINQEGIVVTEEGEPTKVENMSPSAPEAPKQSKVLEEEEIEQVAKNAISLEVSQENGFNPRSFKVKPGQAVTILMTSVDNRNHNLAFKDKSLRGVGLYIYGGESKAVTFNAPTQMGVYEFVDSFRIENVGSMIVTEE